MTHVRILILSAFMFGCDAAESGPAGEPVTGPQGAPIAGTCAVDPGAASDPFVDCVESLDASDSASFGHDALPDVVLGPPIGGSPTMGSMDVVSLGCDGMITLAWDGPPVSDGDGPDFIVFENAFLTGDESFAEPGQVLVSADGTRWYAFDCDAEGGWPAEGCAGVTPTSATDAAEAVDPTRAGGDAFDLADLGLAQIRFVRIVDRTRDYYEGADTWCMGASGGFDLDAIARVEMR